MSTHKLKENITDLCVYLVRYINENKAKDIVLTNIKLKALLGERVAASSGPVVLFQNQNFLSYFGQQHRKPQPSDSTADDDGIQVVRYFTGQET